MIWLAVALLTVCYFVIGGQPATASAQNLFTSDAGFPIMAGGLVAAAGLSLLLLLAGLRGLAAARRAPVADPGAGLVLGLIVRAGALAGTGLVLVKIIDGSGPRGRLVPSTHALDALGDSLTVLGLGIVLLSLILFPPFALAATATGAVLMPVLTAELAAGIAAGVVTTATGVMLNEAANSADSSAPGGGSGAGEPPSPAARTKEMLEHPEQFEGQTPASVAQELDNTLDPSTWTRAAVKKGEGTRWFTRQGDSFTVEHQPGVGGDLHSGWYLKVAFRGAIRRIPLDGNPVLGPR